MKRLLRAIFGRSSPLTFRKINVDKLVSNRKMFEQFVYTPFEEAKEELKKRWNLEIPNLESVPEFMKDGFRGVMFRQLATPNYEALRFINMHDGDLKPTFFEYYEDKFTSQNELKHSLGKLLFFNGLGKKGGAKIDCVKIIDFNTSDGRKISEVCTLWGQSMVDFHKEKFSNWNVKNRDIDFFEASQWFSQNGGSADKYYKSFLRIFLKHGILFENFVLESSKEREFIKTVFLPAFIDTWRKTGIKPLIVSLAPTDIEGEKFWLCHEYETKEHVMKKLETHTPFKES